MNIKELKNRVDFSNDEKLNRTYAQFGELLNELKKKELSQDIYKLINESVDTLNVTTLNGTQLTKLLPIGAAIGSVSGNMGVLGAGLPIGMGIGIAVGMSMDKKAINEGRQLDIEIKN